jgi:hypothetical protein
MDERQVWLGITVITENHASSETWVVSSAFADALRADLGEPYACQLIPMDVAQAIIDHPQHVSVVNLGTDHG